KTSREVDSTSCDTETGGICDVHYLRFRSTRHGRLPEPFCRDGIVNPFPVRRRHGNKAAVSRDLYRLAAAHRHAIDLSLAGARGCEINRLSIRGEGRNGVVGGMIRHPLRSPSIGADQVYVGIAAWTRAKHDRWPSGDHLGPPA